MGFDKNAFKQEISNDPKRTFSGGPRTPFVSPSQFTEGRFKMRFFPNHPEKCPDGYVRLATHRIEVKAGEKPVSFLCRKPAPCAFCQFLEKCVPHGGRFDEETKTLLGMLDPWVRYLFPISIYAEPASEIKEGNNYPDWEKSENENVAILQIDQKSILTDIQEAFEEDPNLNDAKTGRYVQFSKEKNKYSLKPSLTQGPIDHPDLVEKKYPKLKGMFDKKMGASFDKMVALLSEAWWVEKVEKKIGSVELSEDEEEFSDFDDIPF